MDFDYGEILKFSFSWVKRTETLKYAALKWAVELVLILLVLASVFVAFAPLILGFLANPADFIANSASNLVQLGIGLMGGIVILLFLFAVLSIASLFVELYLSVLFSLYALRQANLPTAPFNFNRLIRLFVLQITGGFLVMFSGVHKNVWLIFAGLALAMVLLILGFVNPLFIFAGIALALLSYFSLFIFPLYLYFKADSKDTIIIHKKLLLLPPTTIFLFLLFIFLGPVNPIFAILIMLLLMIIILAYICVIIYNTLRVVFSEIEFISSGKGIFDSLRASIELSEGKVSTIFVASLIWLVFGIIVFYILYMIMSSVLAIIVLPFVPADVWGLETFLLSLSTVSFPAGTLLESVRVSVARTIAENIWAFIVAPFSILFSIFFTVGVYRNALLGKKQPKK